MARAVTATGSWTIYKWGWQFSGGESLDEAYVPFFGAFGAGRQPALIDDGHHGLVPRDIKSEMAITAVLRSG